MKFEFIINKEYGRIRMRPHNDNAKTLISLMRKKTLTQEDYQKLIGAGWDVMLLSNYLINLKKE